MLTLSMAMLQFLLPPFDFEDISFDTINPFDEGLSEMPISPPPPAPVATSPLVAHALSFHGQIGSFNQRWVIPLVTSHMSLG
jgi:hypothetical protein